MKLHKIIFQMILCVLIVQTNLNAQYDNGTVIYNQNSDNNLTAILNNYKVVDFDGDGYSDIVMIKEDVATNTNQLTWYKGNRSGNFSPQANILSINDDHKENEIFYADMNEDGIKDVVFQNSDTGFEILLNDGQGNIVTQINNEVTIDNPFASVLKEIADIDGDGDMDGVFWNKIDNYNFPEYQGHCLIGYNDGNGSFSSYMYLDNEESEMFLIVETGDIDGDGDLDIFCSGKKVILADVGPPFYVYPFVRLYKNLVSNNFVKEEIELPSNSILFSNIKVKDINKDGSDELLIEFAVITGFCGGHGGICGSTNEFQVLDYDLQNGEFFALETYNTWLHSYSANEFLYGLPSLYDDAFHIQFGHQNLDNNLDILSVNVPQGKLQWYLGNGNGSFDNTQVVNINSQYSSTRPTLRVADIDNDTDLDIFVLLNDNISSNLTVFKNLTLTPSCTPLLDLENTSLTDGIYQAGTTVISSGNVVAGNNNVVLKAGNNVKLQSGFTAPVNSSLKVRISSCN